MAGRPPPGSPPPPSVTSSRGSDRCSACCPPSTTRLRSTPRWRSRLSRRGPPASRCRRRSLRRLRRRRPRRPRSPRIRPATSRGTRRRASIRCSRMPTPPRQMRLGELMRAAPAHAASLDVAGITADSRAVAPGYVFAALPGTREDGRRFIADAVAKGACAVLAPTGTAWPPGVPPRPLIEAEEPRRELALMAARLAGPQPAHIAAVTGTNGKTSTVDFLRQIWTLAGKPAASLGTLGLIAPGMPAGEGLTTPDPVTLSETLARLRRAGIGHAAMGGGWGGVGGWGVGGVGGGAGGLGGV